MAVNVSLYHAELRLARYYAGKLHQIHAQYHHGGAAMTAALLTFDAEWSQIRHWHQRVTAVAASDDEFAYLVTEFARYMLTARQNYEERSEWLQSALEAARQLNDMVKEAFMLQELSYIALDRGETDKSRALAEQSLDAALKSRDERSILWSHIRIANAARWMGDLDVAEKYCQAASESTAMDQDAQVVIYNVQAQVAMHRGAMARAIEITHDMIAIIYQVGNLQRLAIAFHSLSIFYFMLGDLGKADYHLSESIQLVRHLEDRKGLPHGLMMQALIALELGHLKEANAYTVEQELVAREVGSPIQVILAKNQYGAIERLRGNYLESRQHFESALEDARAIQNDTVAMDAVLGLARLALDAGEFSNAFEYCQELLLESNAQHIDPTMLWEPRMGLGLIAYAKGDYEQAIARCQQALPLANDVSTSLIEVYWALAEIYYQAENLSAAQDILEQAYIIEQKNATWQIPRMVSIRAVQAKVSLQNQDIQHAYTALCDALRRTQSFEWVMPQIHIVEAVAEYWATLKDSRCIALFSLIAHHPASKVAMSGAMERRRHLLAVDFATDMIDAAWQQNAVHSLDVLMVDLRAEFVS